MLRSTLCENESMLRSTLKLSVNPCCRFTLAEWHSCCGLWLKLMLYLAVPGLT